MNSSKVRITIVIVLNLILIVHGVRVLQDSRRAKLVLARQQAKAHGNPKASLKIVEFTDFQCPACAKGNFALKKYTTFFPDQIYVEYKHFPLAMHPQAMPIAIAAECAAQQNKFWAFHDLAFERQNLLKESINLSGRLQEMATEIGLNVKSFQACLADPKAREVVLRDQEEGKARKVGATPTYFIGDKTFVGGVQLTTELEKTLGRLP